MARPTGLSLLIATIANVALGHTLLYFDLAARAEETPVRRGGVRRLLGRPAVAEA